MYDAQQLEAYGVITAAQRRAIEHMQKTGKPAGLGRKTSENLNTISARSAESLERMGFVQISMGADCRYAMLVPKGT